MAKLEDNLKKLEEIIDTLENEDTGLEQSFKIYEQGMKLVAACNGEIDKVERKLIVLQEASDETIDERKD